MEPVVGCSPYLRLGGTRSEAGLQVPREHRMLTLAPLELLLNSIQKIAAIHISDLTSLYERIVAGILVENEPESGEKGYYFGIAHDLHWHEVAARFAVTMKARHLVTDTETGTWATGEDAAEALGVPRMFVQVLWNSGYVRSTPICVRQC